MSEYNGWTNYATWRINLEIFDGMELSDFPRERDPYDLGLIMKDYVEDMIEGSARGIARDYGLAFIQDVNWTEIAKHKIEEYADDEEDSEDEDA